MRLRTILLYVGSGLIVGFVVLVVGILMQPARDVVEESFETYYQAVNKGALENGLIPDFLPKSATRIIARRNIDLNTTLVEFSYKEEDFAAFLAMQVTAALPDASKVVTPHASEIGLNSNNSITYIPKVNTPDEYSQGELIVNTTQQRALFSYDPDRNTK